MGCRFKKEKNDLSLQLLLLSSLHGFNLIMELCIGGGGFRLVVDWNSVKEGGI